MVVLSVNLTRVLKLFEGVQSCEDSVQDWTVDTALGDISAKGRYVSSVLWGQ